MLTVLNFCSKDRDLALGLLRWIQQLGDHRRHNLILLTGIQAAASGLHQELELLAGDIFGKVEMRFTDTQDERGWPMSPNNAWRDTVFFMRMKVGLPWLWLEPDVTPIPLTAEHRAKYPGAQTWLDCLDIAYEAAVALNKPFMGAEIKHPQHRLSGIAVYPAYVTEYTKRLPSLPEKVPFDQYFASDFVPRSHFTPLIQNIWNVEFGKPETIPTFPDADSLKMLDPQAVLFHRCKDGSLIERLQEKKAIDTSHEVDKAAIRFMTNDGPLGHESSLMARDARIAELERLLSQRNGGDEPCAKPQPSQSIPSSASTAAPTFKPRARRKKKRTPAEQAKINERMAKLRARKVAA